MAGVCFVATWLVAATAKAQQLIWDSGSWDADSWAVPEPSAFISGVVALGALSIVRLRLSRRSVGLGAEASGLSGSKENRTR